jgi:hypothetical protein
VDVDSRVRVSGGFAAVTAVRDLYGIPIVGFFSHVQPERAAAARAAGCTWALPRSAFVRQLEGLLRHPPDGLGQA